MQLDKKDFERFISKQSPLFAFLEEYLAHTRGQMLERFPNLNTAEALLKQQQQIQFLDMFRKDIREDMKKFYIEKSKEIEANGTT